MSSITFASKNEPAFGKDVFVYCQLNKVIVPNDCKYNKMKNMVILKSDFLELQSSLNIFNKYKTNDKND